MQVPPNLCAAGLHPAAAVLSKVRAIVPPQFLKTSDNIHRHKKVLHNTLLNNLRLHDMLRGDSSDCDPAGADPAPLLNALDKGRIAAVAVQRMQRTATISGAACAFADRAFLRCSTDSSGAVSRLYNPLVSFFGAPGGGLVGVQGRCNLV